MGGTDMTSNGSIKSYLEYFVESSVSRYPIIAVDRKSGSNIEYIELRESGDVIHIAGRDVGLNGLLIGAGIHGLTYVSQLIRDVLKDKELKFSIGSEGTKIGEITLDNNKILEIGSYQRELQYAGKLVRA